MEETFGLTWTSSAPPWGCALSTTSSSNSELHDRFCRQDFDCSCWKPDGLIYFSIHAGKQLSTATISHSAFVNFFLTAALCLFQSHSGGAHPVLLAAEGPHSGGGGEGG